MLALYSKCPNFATGWPCRCLLQAFSLIEKCVSISLMGKVVKTFSQKQHCYSIWIIFTLALTLFTKSQYCFSLSQLRCLRDGVRDIILTKPKQLWIRNIFFNSSITCLKAYFKSWKKIDRTRANIFQKSCRSCLFIPNLFKPVNKQLVMESTPCLKKTLPRSTYPSYYFILIRFLPIYHPFWQLYVLELSSLPER